MEIKKIRQLADIMQRSGLSELEWEEGGSRLRLARTVTGVAVAPDYAALSAPASLPGAEAPAADKAEAETGPVITSPMVGTFYAAPAPDSPPFVKVGQNLDADTTVCIIEAMKVMNEIQAETQGEVAAVLVENGESVEFGQPLFQLK